MTNMRCLMQLMFIVGLASLCGGCSTTDQLKRTFQPGGSPSAATTGAPAITVMHVGSVVSPDAYYIGRNATWIGDARVSRDYDPQAICTFAEGVKANHVIIYEPIKDFTHTWWPSHSVVVRFEHIPAL